MTQEEKSILLQDLATRLPYRVKVYINSCIDEQNQMGLFDVNFASETIGVCNEKWAFRAIPIVDIDDNTKIVKPYLRPMSSMTEEERKEYELLANHCIVTSIGFAHLEAQILINWLNAHHFDYRGLIPMALALEAPAEMYKD